MKQNNQADAIDADFAIRLKMRSKRYCECGHNELAHVHFNGVFFIAEGILTYCGFPDRIGDEYIHCQCDSFKLKRENYENNC